MSLLQLRKLRLSLSNSRPLLGAVLSSAALLLGTAGGMSAQGIPGYVVLPLSSMHNANQATLRVSLNGRSTILILHTGASVTVLDSAFYKGVRSKSDAGSASELPPGLQKHATANGVPAEVGYISSLQSGSMDFGKGPALVVGLTRGMERYNSEHSQTAVGGLLGEDILHRYSAIIDWRRRGVYFNVDPSKRIKMGPGLIAAGWTAIPMATGSARHFFVSCTVSGRPVRLMIDTGAPFTTFIDGILPLTTIYNRDTGASMARLGSTGMTLSMIGSDMEMHPARVEHWKIGNFEIANSSVAVARLPHLLASEQVAGDGPILGLIEAELLAANHAIIDVGGSTLYLKAN